MYLLLFTIATLKHVRAMKERNTFVYNWSKCALPWGDSGGMETLRPREAASTWLSFCSEIHIIQIIGICKAKFPLDNHVNYVDNIRQLCTTSLYIYLNMTGPHPELIQVP